MGLSTFSTALSGLSTNSQGLNVVGNNLANLNTVGFKASTISFTDVLGQEFTSRATPASGSAMTIGLGSQVGSVRQFMSQGTIQTTSNPLDVAIQGKGFLTVKNNDGQFYTRAGNLHIDANGYLVNDAGALVQGYTRNPATGQVDTTLGMNSIQLPSGVNNPVKTSLFEIAANLDANAADGSQFTANVEMYDSLGAKHTATVTFQKENGTGATPQTTWHFDITIPNNEIAGVPATDTQKYSLITGGVPAAGAPAGGALVFDSNGQLTSAYIGAAPATLPAVANLTFPPSGTTLGALASGGLLSPTFTWKLLADKTNTPDITGYGVDPNGHSEVTASVQNGSPAGSLSNLNIGPDGMISAIFNNGTTSDVGQIVLAEFTNTDGLVSQGNSLYAESVASGTAFFGVPGEGGRGPMLGGALEQSNVDMAAELTKIITFQRGYQANARMITVTDQIMQEIMNMRQ
jgi:flagellar hook protein FlgE